MYFELNRHPAQVPSTKIEYLGGLISDLEHCALADLVGNHPKLVSVGFGLA